MSDTSSVISPSDTPSQEGDSTPASSAASSVPVQAGAPPATFTGPDPSAPVAPGVPEKRGRGRPRKDAQPMTAEQRAALSATGVNPYPQPPPVLVPIAARKPTRPVEYENLGLIAASAWFSAGETLFGEDWRPIPAEQEGIPKAFAAYFKAKEIGDLPPGVALAIALGSYSLPRLTKPTVKERVASGWSWIKEKVAAWRARRR